MIYVYALLDPFGGPGCYVGKTVDVVKRYNEHLRADSGSKEKRAWISGIKAAGKNPVLYIFEIVSQDEGAKQEDFWMGEVLNLGFKLLNSVLSEAVWKINHERRVHEKKCSEALEAMSCKRTYQNDGSDSIVWDVEQESILLRNLFFKKSKSSDFVAISRNLNRLVLGRIQLKIAKKLMAPKSDRVKRLYCCLLHEMGKPEKRWHSGAIFGIMLCLSLEGEDTRYFEGALSYLDGCDGGEFGANVNLGYGRIFSDPMNWKLY